MSSIGYTVGPMANIDGTRPARARWTVRGLDTVLGNPDRVAARILRETKPGAIILLHEAHRVEKNPEFNPLCLELTLNGLAELGYRCVIPAPEQLTTAQPR